MKSNNTLKKYKLIPIQKIDTYETNNTLVYDLTVNKNHSYCVDNNIIVHNSGCTTYNATGVKRNAISILTECKYTPNDVSKFKKTHNYTFIADGGVKEPKDLSIALALGANFVMIGAGIANTTESPAVKNDGHTIFSGSASFENQKNYKENPKYIEGKTVLLNYNGESLYNYLNRFKEGLLSSCSYMDARNIEEFKKKVNYEIV